MAESEKELKSLLMRVKEEREKADLLFNIQKTKVMASIPITSWQIGGGKSGNSGILYFLALALQTVTVAMNLNTFAPWKNSYDKPIQCIKKQTSLCQQNPYSQSYGFSNSHVRI